MALPFFYKEDIDPKITTVIPDDDTSKHILQVLRMKNGEQVQLTDGRGNRYVAEITEKTKKSCTLQLLSSSFEPEPEQKIIIAISLVKNTHRFEWFLEKAAEIGVSNIFPLLCARTEKQHFRYDRMKGILISAMLQSQQSWLPVLEEPEKFSFFIQHASGGQKFIAHCEDKESNRQLSAFRPFDSPMILIGPEGDFTTDEIEAAYQHNFVPVALGYTRLRTETAGVVAATILKLS